MIPLTLAIWTAWGVVGETPRLTATAQRPETRVQIESSASLAIVDIRCPFGIDQATLQRESPTWPDTVKLRLHLTGLESLQVRVGETTVEWSVASTGQFASRVTLRHSGRETVLDRESPFHRPVAIVGPAPRIPLRDGYFETSVPAKLLADNPPSIRLHWIDFFRN